MSAKPATFEGRIANLLRMLISNNEGEVTAALHALVRTVLAAGSDKVNTIHKLADQIEGDGDNKKNNAPLNAAQMQKIYDAAYQKGFSDGSEHGRKSAIVAAPSIGTFNLGTGSGVNGYSWQEIARHCLLNKHLFSGRDHNFIESIAEQVEYRNPSPPQAKWLKDLFLRRFNGRID
jgi:hypothetical protein